MVIIVMGVSGSGKSTIGTMLAEKLACEFADGDDFHSKENKEKMSNGIPLDDNDRASWLLEMKSYINNYPNDKPLIMASSALKKKYRDVFREADRKVVFAYLDSTKETIKERLAERKGHFFNPKLMDSQFNDLEVPNNAIYADIRKSPEDIIKEITLQIDKILPKNNTKLSSQTLKREN